jgi:HEAT repeat protein
MALGLAEHDRRGRPLDEEGVALPLRRRLDDVKDGKTRAAYAVALGLVRDARAVPALVAVIEDDRLEARLRGYAALALGMIGADEGRAAVRAALVEDGDRELRILASMGAGLLGDPRAVDDLVRILGGREESQHVLGSAALALGRIGDERAVDPLLALARDRRKFSVLTRALAVVALGQIGDRSDVPTLARFAQDTDYRAATPAITELLTIL